MAKTAVASSQRLEVFLAAAPCRGRGGGREGKGCAHVCARRGHSDITALPRDNPSLDLCPSPAISASPARQRAARLGPARSRHTEREGKGLSGSERPSETVLGETRYVSAPSQCQVSTTGDPPPPAEVTPEAPRLGGGPARARLSPPRPGLEAALSLSPFLPHAPPTGTHLSAHAVDLVQQRDDQAVEVPQVQHQDPETRPQQPVGPAPPPWRSGCHPGQAHESNTAPRAHPAPSAEGSGWAPVSHGTWPAGSAAWSSGGTSPRPR